MSASPLPLPTGADPDPGLVVTVEGLRYALDRPPRPQGRRSVARVCLAEHAEAPGFVDRVDLYAYRSRAAFARRVADAFGREAGAVLGHLAVILDEAERAAAAARAARPRSGPEAPTAARRRDAEALLAEPDLLERAAAAMTARGHVGEEAVKRLTYLVATSRLMACPLSALLLAPSGAGKSAVLDAVAALLPPEDVVPLARLTAHALYYMGRDALRHKLVVVDEYEGAGEADHPLRVLQSKGELRLSLAVRGRAEELVAEGPVAFVSGTTAVRLDVQNASRCVELCLDDGPEQTRRVQAAQARAWAGRPAAAAPGPGAGAGRGLEAWRDAQRVLEPLEVVVPFAERLTFPADAATDRRTPTKLLGLVGAHALLHQRQRQRDELGRVLAEVADYRAVHDLLRPQLEAGRDGLPPRAARALGVLAAAGAPRTRREVARALGWHYMTAARALADLEAHELVRAVDRGTPRRYRVVEAGLLGAGADLLDPGAL